MYSVISSKHNVILSRSKESRHTYRIQFALKSNTKLCPHEHVNLSLYDTLFQLNKDVFERIDVVLRDDKQSAEVVMFLKQFGKEFGLKPRFICSEATLVNHTNNPFACIVGRSVPILDGLNVDGYDEIICNDSRLFAFWDETQSSLIVQYDFSICQDSHDSIPETMRDFSALLLKKVFIRMKEYKDIEIKSN